MEMFLLTTHFLLSDLAAMYYAFMDAAETVAGFRERHDRKVYYLLSVITCQELGERDCQVVRARKDWGADMRC